MNLAKDFKKLLIPKGKNSDIYNTKNIQNSNNHFIGINGLGHIALLFSTKSPKGKEENIQNLQLNHSIKATIKFKGNKTKKKFSILKCTSNDERLKEIFLSSLSDSVKNIKEDISEKEIYEKTKSLIELYRKISQNKNNDLVGFWGELFVIHKLKSTDLLVEAWHPETTDTFDFYLKNQALEIKTTTSNDRKHQFSYEQLDTRNKKIIIASIMIRKSRTGKNLLNLKNSILKKLNKETNKEKVQEMYDVMTGLKSKKELDEISFSYEYSKDNLSFYDASNVPRIKEALMNGIKSIKYESNFNSSKEIKDFSKYNFLK
jgi:hypothetical protein